MEGLVENMKKKNIIFVVLLVVVIISILLFVAYKIDMKRMENNQPILFSTWGYQYVPPVEDYYFGEKEITLDESYKTKRLEDIPKDYTMKNAIEDGCFVISNDKKIYNKNILDAFIESTKYNNLIKTEDNILHIVSFTVEGDMIITEIEYITDENYFSYDPNNYGYGKKFIVRIDDTRDEYSGKRGITVNESKISASIYEGKLKLEDEYVVFSLSIPEGVEIFYDKSDSQAYKKDIVICRYPASAKIVNVVSVDTIIPPKSESIYKVNSGFEVCNTIMEAEEKTNLEMGLPEKYTNNEVLSIRNISVLKDKIIEIGYLNNETGVEFTIRKGHPIYIDISGDYTPYEFEKISSIRKVGNINFKGNGDEIKNATWSSEYGFLYSICVLNGVIKEDEMRQMIEDINLEKERSYYEF